MESKTSDSWISLRLRLSSRLRWFVRANQIVLSLVDVFISLSLSLYVGLDEFTFCEDRSCHGIDLSYTFNIPNANFTSNGRYISRTLVDYWTNFAKTNDPQSSQGVTWPRYYIKTKNFLKFQKPKNKIYSRYQDRSCEFFDSIGYYF